MQPISAFDALPELCTATLIWQGSDAPANVYQAAQNEIDFGYQIEAVVMGADADWVTMVADPLGDFLWVFPFSWGPHTFTVAAVCSETTASG